MDQSIVNIKLFICVFGDFFVRNSLAVANQKHVVGTIQLLDGPFIRIPDKRYYQNFPDQPIDF